ncbi:MAG: SAM-dependent methyltransferase [Geodermatophilaceae bacterium]|nr:SAM-dependent methyltransferase [Geodermatophilaceae bacterium]
MTDALYGEQGFYRSPDGPAAHFRTSAHTGRLFAAAVAELLERVDRALGYPPRLDLVDVGAGRGELLGAVARLAAAGLSCAPRLRLTGVEVAPRPGGLPAQIAWTQEIPPVTGLLIANEWLDVVPVDVVEQTGDGPRTVLVDRFGVESLGPPPAEADLAWLAQWWPLPQVGGRAEIGRSRDTAWAGALARVRRGLGVAVDYGHTKAERPPGGSLVGYRRGAAVLPVPDGTCDLTAHVAWDSCQAAEPGNLMTQRAALTDLGMSAARPPRALAWRDPPAYLAALRDVGEAAELTDPGGLGGFGWLLCGVAMTVPLGSERVT